MKEDEAADLLRALGQTDVPSEREADQRARREKLVVAIEDDIVRAAARQRLRTRVFRGGLLVAAAAAVVLLASGMVHRASTPDAPDPAIARAFVVEGASFRAHAGAAQSLVGAEDLDPGDELTTSPTGRARVTLKGGAIVELDPASDVRFDDDARVAIEAGNVTVFVPALGKNRRTSVTLLGALIEIDDRASVAVDVDPRTKAVHVSVLEGTVSLHSSDGDVALAAGDEWPTHAAATDPLPKPSVAPSPTAVVSVPTVGPGTVRVLPTASAASPTSSLADQNRLLQGALDARRRGDPRKALSLVDELLARYPGSPLTQAARVERFRSLDQSGQHDSAAKEARSYLADYPQGFARAEAQALEK